MTIVEMHYDFDFKYDKVDSQKKKNLIPAEKDWILNESIKIITKQKYGMNNAKQAGFESIHKRTADLMSLQIKSPTSVQPAVVPTDIGNEVYELKIDDLAKDYWFMTRITAKASKSGCGVKIVEVNEVQHDDLSTILNSPFEAPSFEWGEVPCVFGRSTDTADGLSSVYLYGADDFTITEVYPEYVKKPNRISIGGYTYIDGSTATAVQCDLPELVHEEIVDIAVAEATRINNVPQLYQLMKEKTLINE